MRALVPLVGARAPAHAPLSVDPPTSRAARGSRELFAPLRCSYPLIAHTKCMLLPTAADAPAISLLVLGFFLLFTFAAEFAAACLCLAALAAACHRCLSTVTECRFRASYSIFKASRTSTRIPAPIASDCEGDLG